MNPLLKLPNNKNKLTELKNRLAELKNKKAEIETAIKENKANKQQLIADKKDALNTQSHCCRSG